jgi:hypothetical protein
VVFNFFLTLQKLLVVPEENHLSSNKAMTHPDSHFWQGFEARIYFFLPLRTFSGCIFFFRLMSKQSVFFGFAWVNEKKLACKKKLFHTTSILLGNSRLYMSFNFYKSYLITISSTHIGFIINFIQSFEFLPVPVLVLRAHARVQFSVSLIFPILSRK